MEKQIVFKSAINGFEKKAVLDYIYKLNQDAEESSAELESQIKSVTGDCMALDASLRNKEAECKSISERCDTLTGELETERSRTDELSEIINGLNAEIDSLKDSIARKDTEIREYVRINKELKQTNEELEKKKLEIDVASTKIGKLLIEAHAEADSLVDAAQDSADVMLDQARQRSEGIISEAENRANTIIAEAEANSARMLEEAGANAEETISKADADSTRIINEAEEASSRKMDDAQRAVDMSMEKLSLYRSQISNIQRVILDSLEDIHQRTAEISATIDLAQDMMVYGPRPENENGDQAVNAVSSENDGIDITEDKFFR